jgi:hypothetical protein
MIGLLPTEGRDVFQYFEHYSQPPVIEWAGTVCAPELLLFDTKGKGVRIDCAMVNSFLLFL